MNTRNLIMAALLLTPLVAPRASDTSATAGRPNVLINLADDLGETNNRAAAKPELVAEMGALLEKLIADGRSTPGVRQRNDVAVRRHVQDATAKGQPGSQDRVGKTARR